jgi:DmsE family decaheme c-type cytochrome
MTCIQRTLLLLLTTTLLATFSNPALCETKREDIIFKGDAKCTRCHDDEDSPKLMTIGKTRHGLKADHRAPDCVVCHGDSIDHISYKGDDNPPPPDRALGRKSTLSAEAKNAVCVSCHQGGKRMHWSSSLHNVRDVACTSCHDIHNGTDKVRDKRTQPQVCYTCHKQQRAEGNKPSHHPIPEGKMTCSDCHNSHGSAGQGSLVKDTVNATCFTCHPEKRGPFLHNHQPVVESCSNCHNPHGTTADSLLKSRMPFLCQQCHSSASHPGNVPGTRDFMPNAISSNIGPGFAQARGCANCHTNVHGSNNPSSATSGGAFRFFR